MIIDMKKADMYIQPPPCIPFPSILHPPTLPSPPSMTASFVAKLAFPLSIFSEREEIRHSLLKSLS